MRKGVIYISGILIFTFLFSSCVSKKKYEELARAKRSIDREVETLVNDKKSLESEIQKLKDDFNAVRYQLPPRTNKLMIYTPSYVLYKTRNQP